MKYAVFATIAFLTSVASAFHIVPPSSIIACSPLTVEYDTTTGTPPFSLSFHTGGSGGGPTVAAFTDISGTSFTWSMVTIPAGTQVVIVLADSGGHGSETPAITVSPGSSDVCLDNPTSIPSLPPVTSTSPPTSTFSGSPSPSSLPPNSTTVSTPTPSSVLSSISSLSSVLSSANSQLSSLTQTTNTSPRPSPTGGLGTSGGVANAAGFFGVGVITAIMGALLA